MYRSPKPAWKERGSDTIFETKDKSEGSQSKGAKEKERKRERERERGRERKSRRSRKYDKRCRKEETSLTKKV